MAEEKKTTTKTTKTPAKSTATKATTKTTATKKVSAPKVEKVAEVKAEVEPKEVKVVSKPKKVAEKQLKVTLVKSTIGYNKNQAKVVKALGLGKLNSSHVLPDNTCVRGMINKVSHLVKVEELN